MYQLNLKTETNFQKTKNLTPKGEKSNLSLTTQKVVSKLQKERLTKDVRYQEFNELTLDQKAYEGSTDQGLVLCRDAPTGNSCTVAF